MAGPFKMKSGNSPLFKQMGSSPLTKSYKQSYNEENSKVNKKKYDTYEKYEKAAKDYNKDKYGTTEPTQTSKDQGITKPALADARTKGNVRTKAHEDRYTVKKAEEGVAKSQKDVKATIKEVASTITKKDLRKQKKAKIKAIRDKAKSLKGTASRKDIREAKKEDIKAARKKFKTAKKTLKTLKKSGSSPARMIPMGGPKQATLGQMRRARKGQELQGER